MIKKVCIPLVSEAGHSHSPVPLTHGSFFEKLGKFAFHPARFFDPYSLTGHCAKCGKFIKMNSKPINIYRHFIAITYIPMSNATLKLCTKIGLWCIPVFLLLVSFMIFLVPSIILSCSKWYVVDCTPGAEHHVQEEAKDENRVKWSEVLLIFLSLILFELLDS